MCDNTRCKIAGYTYLMQGVTMEEAAFITLDTRLSERAMSYFHLSALDEYERRMSGDKPDDVHLIYL